jgi:hypothetical protein
MLIIDGHPAFSTATFGTKSCDQIIWHATHIDVMSNEVNCSLPPKSMRTISISSPTEASGFFGS